jgi:hypothetical protein
MPKQNEKTKMAKDTKVTAGDKKKDNKAKPSPKKPAAKKEKKVG